MVVNRLLDAFFKTLDVVDAARDRVDNALGRKPRPDPWAVEWPTPPNADEDEEAKKSDLVDDDESTDPQRSSAKKKAKANAQDEDAKNKSAADADGAKDAPTKKASPKDVGDKASAPKAKKSTTKKTAAKKSAAKKSGEKKPAKKKTTKKSRKGSVDRSGKDFDSARADTVAAQMAKARTPILTEEADYNGKKVLGRVLWALWVAEQSGETEGMTTADVSALLHLTAKMDVYSTNVGRACRDHADLITVGKNDGRSKRYLLTAAGRTAAATISTTSSTED